MQGLQQQVEQFMQGSSGAGRAAQAATATATTSSGASGGWGRMLNSTPRTREHLREMQQQIQHLSNVDRETWGAANAGSFRKTGGETADPQPVTGNVCGT